MVAFAYLLRGALARLGLTVAILATIYLAFQLGDQGRRLAVVVGWRAVAVASLLHLPLVFVQVMPAAVLISFVLWLGGLRARGELLALGLAGARPRHVFAPLLVGGALATFVALTASEVVVPPAEAAADRWYQGRRPSPLTGERQDAPWVRHGAWFVRVAAANVRESGAHRAGPGRRSHARPQPSGGDERAVLALSVDGAHRIRQRVEGVVRTGAPAIVRRARVIAFDGNTTTRRATPRYRLDALAATTALWATPRRAEAQGRPGLERELEQARRAGHDATAATLIAHTRFAFPLLNIVVACFACGFAGFLRRRAPVADLGLAVGILLVMWSLIAVGWLLARVGLVAPVIGAWLPIGLAAATSVAFATRAAVERSP